MKTIGLNLSGAEVYEAGASLLTILALPRGPTQRWTEAGLHAALCGYALRCAAARDDGWCWTPQPIKPGYLLVSSNDADRAIRFVQKEVGKSLRAATVAIGVVQDEIARASEGHRKGRSINSLAAIAAGINEQDPHNFESRVFRPARPVLHITIAIALLLENASLRGAGIEHFLLEADLLKHVVAHSNEVLDILSRQRRFTLNPHEMVRLVVV